MCQVLLTSILSEVFVRLIKLARTTKCIFTINKGADLGVGPGGPCPQFCPEIVNVCRMVLRALLLKYIFFNKQLLIRKDSVFEGTVHF